ncbi:MAG: hypothetical protein IH840_15850 [Candidatus Heimdallarchaeota archaeon]|nr:hypothetical protein [Candidatus Heimdallarchaeota archaeon]
MKSVELLRKAEIAESKIISLVASESLMYPWISHSLASTLHIRTVEGCPGKRNFPTSRELDDLECYASSSFQNLFKMSWADIRPYTATNANLAVALALLRPGDIILSLKLSDGGHLSHGFKTSFIGRSFNVVHYSLDEDSSTIDLEDVEKKLKKYRPRLIISGGSALPREVQFNIIGSLARKYSVMHLADISHTAGFVAAGIHSPISGASDVVTFGTQKTMLGPRGGVILATEPLIEKISSAVFPGVTGAELLPQIAAKAICADYATTQEFFRVLSRARDFARLFASCLIENDLHVISEGTDSHIILINLDETNTNGKVVEEVLKSANVRVNRNLVPRGRSLGIRLGTTCVAQSRMSREEFIELAQRISVLISQLARGNSYNFELKSLNDLVKLLLTSGKTNFDVLQAGGWASNNILSENDRNRSDDCTLITKKKIFSKKYIHPLIVESSLNVKNPVVKELIGNKVQVIIPARDETITLGEVIKYAQCVTNGARIVVVISGDNAEIRRVAREYHANVIELESWCEKNINWRQLDIYCGIKNDSLPGKGWSILAGLLDAVSVGAKHIYFIDADLQEVEEYGPIEKLVNGIAYSKGKIEHAVIATPGRNNSSIHAAIEILSCGILPSEEEKIILSLLRELIHPLAGERYFSVSRLVQLPIATNYCLETLWALASAYWNCKTLQIANSERKDSLNSYEKNEAMLMECSRFLVAAALSKIAVPNTSLSTYADFNKRYTIEGETTILPFEMGAPVQQLYVRRDRVLPPLNLLLHKNILSL